MKDNKFTIIAGTIIVLAVGFGLVWWLKGIIPEQTSIDQGAVEVKPVDRNILNNPTVKTLQDRQKNGNIPIVISGGDLGKSNPFE